MHPLLTTRGVPGTHDVELAQATIDSLAGDEPALLPAFDKATDDRRPSRQLAQLPGADARGDPGRLVRRRAAADPLRSWPHRSMRWSATKTRMEAGAAT